MNRFPKFKQSSHSNLQAEDSSDYISSDIETNSKDAKHLEGIYNGGSSSNLATNLADDSNDSFMYDRDNDSSSATNFGNSNNGASLGTPSTAINPSTSSSSTIDRRFSQKVNAQGRPLDESRLAECLDHLHRMICRKDKEDIFTWPVTDDIAPGYSLIIKNPMDLSTMKKKIDAHMYSSVMEYRDDLILMCENCMLYNKMDTIYYVAARKMFDYGIKLLSRDKLLSLRHTVRIMRFLTSAELGFSIDGGESIESLYAHNIASKQRTIPQLTTIEPQKSATPQSSIPYISRFGNNTSLILSKAKILQQKLEQSQVKESYLVPPEGEPDEDLDSENVEEMTEEIRKLAKEAAKRLANKNKHGKIGFLRRNSNGTTGYNFLKNSSRADSKEDKQEYSEKSVTIVYYVENGPFGMNAPQFDSSYSNLPKEESDILLTTYGDDTAYQYALSLMEFSKGTGFMFNRYVNLVLNTLSNNEHEKYLLYKQNQLKKLNNETLTAIKQETTSAIKQEKN